MKKPELKKKDKVMIRKDLIVGNKYGDFLLDEMFTKRMEKYRGKIVTIAVIEGELFLIDEDGLDNVWTENMVANYIQQIIE